MMDNCWPWGQYETHALIRWFRCGGHNGSRIRKMLETPECFFLLFKFLFCRMGDEILVAHEIKVICNHEIVVALSFSLAAKINEEYQYGTRVESTHGLVAKVLSCSLKVSEFESQSRYYVHFQTHTFGRRHEPFYPSSYVLNSITAVFLQWWLK